MTETYAEQHWSELADAHWTHRTLSEDLRRRDRALDHILELVEALRLVAKVSEPGVGHALRRGRSAWHGMAYTPSHGAYHGNAQAHEMVAAQALSPVSRFLIARL
jgi:hypothetical protein